MVEEASRITRLALARQGAGFRQRELAELASISPPRLCEYERGSRPPATKQAALSALLGYPPSVLFPADPVIPARCIREWLSTFNDEDPAAEPGPVNTSAMQGQHDES